MVASFEAFLVCRYRGSTHSGVDDLILSTLFRWLNFSDFGAE